MERYSRFHELEELTFSKAVYKLSTAPAKIPVAFSTDTEKKNPKIVWNHKTVNNTVKALRKKNKAEEHVSWFQTNLQICSNQKSMILAQKQTCRPVEQNRELRSEPIHLGQLTFNERQEGRGN